MASQPIASVEKDIDAGEKAIEQWKIKKLIKSLEAARGSVTVDHLLTWGMTERASSGSTHK